jgi:hypothetical protein
METGNCPAQRSGRQNAGIPTMKRIALAAGLVLALAACQGQDMSTRHLAPIPAATMALM